jgi:hypothetical protein
MKKAKLTCLLSILCMLITPAPAIAGPVTDRLSLCLAANTTGKERKVLAKWVFVSISAHPALKDVSKTSTKIRDETDQAVGSLVTRLMTESCVSEFRAAAEQDESQSFQKAFESLGRLAFQELMSDSSVNVSMSGFKKYLDKEKFEAAFSKDRAQ